jgi:IstB-like ATP binding protein
MSDTPQVLLSHHLKALKLPTFLREYDKLARQCAADAVDHVRYLLRLAELELIERERRMIERRIKEARFPAIKSLDSFDFLALPSLNKALVLELARSEYVARRENVIALGNSGTGKSHVALGLGLAACQKGLSVGFTTAAGVVHELIEARDEKRLSDCYGCNASWPATSCWSSMNSVTCRCRRPAPNCYSRCSANATSAVRPSSPPIYRSTNGPACSPPSGSPARCSTGSPTTSTSWR